MKKINRKLCWLFIYLLERFYANMNVCCVVLVIVIVLKNEFKIPGGRLNVSYFTCIPDKDATPEP